MEKKLFREKSINRISSPDQLNDYIHVANPGVWLILLSVIFLLSGVCVWGVFGHLDTKVETVCRVANGKAVCYIKEADISGIEIGTPVSINGAEYKTIGISDFPERITDNTLQEAGHFSEAEKIYAVTVNAKLDAGIYKADFITERVSPMYFVLN